MELIERIRKLKNERNAIIMAHNCQIPEVQDIADCVGDAIGLSIEASKINADIIVFCGVYSMAEMVKILSPQKTVLIPDKDACCPMANMINTDQLRTLKAKHPQAKVLCHVNVTARVKAESDLCCTSTNAVKMVTEVLKNEEEIIFVPDKYLADYVSTQTDRNLIAWKGYCPTHARILPEDVIVQKQLHPRAEVIVHPECTSEVIKLANKVSATEEMCSYVRKTKAKEIIVGTEEGIIHRLKKENPEKLFYYISRLATCVNMKLNNLEKILWSLEDMDYEVKLPQKTISRAKQSIQRMLDCCKDSGEFQSSHWPCKYSTCSGKVVSPGLSS